MPFHFSLPGHHKDKDQADPSSSPIAFRPQSPPSHHKRALSNSSTTTSPPQSILLHTNTNMTSSSEFTNSSTSGSAYLSQRLSNLAPFERSDTITSNQSSNPDTSATTPSSPRASLSTPGTSVSSLGNNCPLPHDDTSGKNFPFFVLTLSSTSTLSFIALPLRLRPAVTDAVHRAWKRGISKTSQVEYEKELMKKHSDRGCEGGVWELTLRDTCWMPRSEDKVSSKRILINLMTVFAREGYNLNSSFRTSAKDSGKDTLIFLRGEPDPDPIFFCVAFHSSDRIWIIDAEEDVGEALEEGIRNWWLGGLRDARVRERHCRELRLKGNPWTAHGTSALISARCIHLVIMKSITHCHHGYDFVGSVDMADMEEGEMPVTFYRKKWDGSSPHWT
ncbi:hypothetical protein P7C73_g3408, partial [Tremellales sp. Uapishka_1]